MSIISWLEARYHSILERKHARAIKRRQFNMTIAEETIVGVKFLAAILEVPQYAVTEHLLQVGCYHILQALKDPQKRQGLEQHLIDVHLLGTELRDDESILRLGP